MLDHTPSVQSALRAMAARVRSGDPENLEAQAARRYWQAFLGPDFRRDADGLPPNSRLNYGYTVLRAAVARAVPVEAPVAVPVPVDRRPARLAASLARLVALEVRRQLRLADPVAAHSAHPHALRRHPHHPAPLALAPARVACRGTL